MRSVPRINQLSPSHVMPGGVVLEEYIGTYHTTSVTLIAIFIALLEEAQQAQQFWCVNCAKNPNVKRENKYLVFHSDHLARAKNG